jgi:hypothetical protein
MHEDSLIYLPCGGKAMFDSSTGVGWRCMDCYTVVGSIGQPKQCVDESKKYDNWKKLGGKGWDYATGKPG